MKHPRWAAAAALFLLPLEGRAQTQPSFTNPITGAPATAGSPISLTQMLSAFGAKADNSQTAAGASHARILSDKLGDLHTPADFLSAGQTTAQLLSGAIDAQPSIAAALAAEVPLTLECGTYTLNEPITPPTLSTPVILGVSPECVTLNVTFATGDIFSLTNPFGAHLGGFTVQAAVQRTSGAVFDFNDGFQGTLADITLSGPHGGDGVLLNGTNTLYISHIQCSTPNPAGTFVIGEFWAGACVHVTGNALEVHVSHSVSDNWHYGMQITSSGGVDADFDDWIAGGNGMYFDPALTTLTGSISGTTLTVTAVTGTLANNQPLVGAGIPTGETILRQITEAPGSAPGGLGTYVLSSSLTVSSEAMTAPQSVWGQAFSHIYADTSFGDNWLFAGTGYISDVQANDSWASNSQGANGIAFNNANILGVQFTNADLLANHGSGVAALLGDGISLVGAQIAMNSQAGSGLYSGVDIGPGVAGLSIEGGFCGRYGVVAAQGTTNQQQYCVNQQPGAAALSSVKVIGMTTKGNVAGAVGGSNAGSINLQAAGAYYSVVNLGNNGN